MFLRYYTVPSPEKPIVDAEPHLHGDHPPVVEVLKDMPKAARKAEKLRVRAFLGIEERAMGRDEFAKVVVDRALQSEEQVLEAAAEDDRLHSFVVNHAKSFGDVLKVAWRIRTAEAARLRKETAVPDLVRAARSAACICAGKWSPAAASLFALHSRDLGEDLESRVRGIFHHALSTGAGKGACVALVGPTNSGKTFLTAPLQLIFEGEVFLRISGSASFPLQDLLGKRIVIMQDLRVERVCQSGSLSWDDLLTWFEGEPVKVSLPRNRYDSDELCATAAPVFVTSSGRINFPLLEALRTGRDVQRESDQMASRFQYVEFRSSLPKPERIKACRRCFAMWLYP